MIGAIEKTKRLNINFEYKINNVENLNIDDVDLSSVFSNILNNAIEACERMPINNRKILLIVNSRSNVLAIEISNTYSGIVRKDGSRFKTIKGNDRDHGLGMNNLKEIVKKYNGVIHQLDYFSQSSVSASSVPELSVFFSSYIVKTSYSVYLDKNGFAYPVVDAPIIIADGIFSRNYENVKIGQKHFETAP